MSTSLVFALFKFDNLFRKSTPGQGENSELDQYDEYYAEQLQIYVKKLDILAERYKDPASNLLHNAVSLLWMACTMETGIRPSYSDLLEVDVEPAFINPTPRNK